jgi:hypothetical protein
MLKHEESKTTQIMMATVRHVTSSSGLRKYPTDGFLSDGVYNILFCFKFAMLLQCLKQHVFILMYFKNHKNTS